MKSLFILAVLSLAVGSAGHAQTNLARDINHDIYAFLSGNGTSSPGGGGVAIVKKDNIQCVATQIAAPGEAAQISQSCVNSQGLAVSSDDDSELVTAIFGLLLPAKPAGGGGGIAVSSKGEITCAMIQIARPGGPVTTSYSCN